MPLNGPLRWKRWSLLAVLVMIALYAQPALAANWSFLLQQGKIELALPDINAEGWSLSGLRADVRTAVEADNRVATVYFRPGSRLYAKQMVQTTSESPLNLSGVQVDLSGVKLSVKLKGAGPLSERVTVSGDVVITLDTLGHPLLQPQGWRFAGTLNSSPSDLRVWGQAQSEAGLLADLEVRRVASEFIAARIDATAKGQKGGDALAGTLSGWPKSVILSSGRIIAGLTLRKQGDRPVEMDGQLHFERVAGVVDRTAVSGLNGFLKVSLEEQMLVARARDVTIDQINPGIAIGPVQVLAEYRAPRANPLAGKLDIQQATAGFLGGRMRVAPGTLDFVGNDLLIPIGLYDISLSKLLQVYPTEGLEGTGQLTGRIPVRISDQGIKVRGGELSARAPGGLLKLPADRLQGMLGGNQAMDLVVRALQNFHYSVLDSTIDYDNRGTLTLDLRLEGENPDVRGGQPVVLNINLEEDIPALLTSLQLSGRVNEAVTERVRERLQQSGQEAVP